jgi:hypothetical protein
VDFKFNEVTVRSLVTEINLVEEKERAALAFSSSTSNEANSESLEGDKQAENQSVNLKKKRIDLGSSCENITINEFVHMVNLLKRVSIEVIIDECDIDKLIQNAKDKLEFNTIENSEGLFEAYTPAGVPLLFACIDNEPHLLDRVWILESVFHKLL